MKERVILVGVQTSGQDETFWSLLELEELAQTAGAEVVNRLVQNREGIHPATYVGKGKIEEIKQMLYLMDATGIKYGRCGCGYRSGRKLSILESG